MRFFAYFIFATGLISGCAVKGPPLVQSSGTALAPNARIAIDAPRDGDAYEADFANALTMALRERNFSIAEDGDFVVQYGVAVRDASIGLARAGEDGKPEDISSSRKGLLLDRCDAQRMRISVTVLDRQNGGAVHRSTADVNGCEFLAVQAASVADQLAARVTNR